MTEKEILLQDLCARLFYNVKVSIPALQQDQIFTLIGITQSYISVEKDNGARFSVPLDIDFKPYLRPMSSMTEEEDKEFWKIVDNDGSDSNAFDGFELGDDVDWLNKHYFDYRGLIPKNLAIAVTRDNNPYK